MPKVTPHQFFIRKCFCQACKAEDKPVFAIRVGMTRRMYDPYIFIEKQIVEAFKDELLTKKMFVMKFKQVKKGERYKLYIKHGKDVNELIVARDKKFKNRFRALLCDKGYGSALKQIGKGIHGIELKEVK